MNRQIIVVLLTALWAFFGLSTTVEATSELSAIGQYTNVVVFVRFADETDYQAPYDLTYYQTLFNGVDTISVRDYFLEVSYDSLIIDSYLINDGSVILFYTDLYDRAYYQPFDATNNPDGYTEFNHAQREHDLLKRAIDFVEAFDLVPDTINLDVNGDGDIDSLTFLVSGETTDWMDILWPHKWSLYTYYNFATQSYDADAPMINGVNAYDYTFELLGINVDYDYAVSVPITSHETFHVLTAPDLYHYYRYDWVDPVGDWGLMDNVSDIPSHMLGYMKLAYGGWIDQANVIDVAGTYSIGPMQDSPNNLYMIPLGYSGEALFLEYRDQTGTYESQTPSSGLIVYRVDFDFADEGNVDGYYLDDGVTAVNEVFVFRPGILDTIAPITFASTDDDTVDEDGVPDLAGLSQLNTYDAIGIGTDIPLFYSDGSLIDITINNIIEQDGVVTFDLHINEPRVDLVSPYTFNNLNNVQLVDVLGTQYYAEFQNVAETDIVYFTQDGSLPTTEDIRYTGSFEITPSTNVIRAIIVDELGEVIDEFDHTFSFVNAIESAHNPYDALEQIYYYLNFEYMTSYTLAFNQLGGFADESDRLWVYEEDQISKYVNNNLRNTDLDFQDSGILLEFYSDIDDNNDYGFKALVVVHQIFTGLTFDLNGMDEIQLEVYDTYDELGVTIAGDNADTAYVVIQSDLDTAVTGTYVITYEIYDASDDLIGTVSRTVVIADTTAPSIALVGDKTMTLEVYDAFVDPGTLVEDNYLLSGNVVITGEVDTTVVGTYTLYYNVFDDAGNMSEILSRTIHIVDTTAPEVSLLAGLDTIYENEDWIDESVLATDNYDTDLTIEILQNTVDTSQPGSYYVLYMIVDTSGNTTYQYRHVTVVEAPVVDPEVVCDVGITTYQVNDEVTPPTCRIGDIVLEVDVSLLDLSTPGTKTILYYTVLNGIRYEHISYLFVLPQYDIEIVWWNDEKQGGFR